MTHPPSLAALATAAAIALVASSCDARHQTAGPSIGAPLAHFEQFECVPFKITGGGRIDYPPGSPEKNPPASHLYQTFGAHVIAEPTGTKDNFGRCEGGKGSLQWVDHRPEWRINGRPLNFHSTAITFAQLATDTDCSDGAAEWGGTLVIKNTGEEAEFEVWDCDNGEPGVGHDGFALRVYTGTFNYEVICTDPALPPAEPACTLTGGNRQFHPTH